MNRYFKVIRQFFQHSNIFYRVAFSEQLPHHFKPMPINNYNLFIGWTVSNSLSELGSISNLFKSNCPNDEGQIYIGYYTKFVLKMVPSATCLLWDIQIAFIKREHTEEGTVFMKPSVVQKHPLNYTSRNDDCFVLVDFSSIAQQRTCSKGASILK